VTFVLCPEIAIYTIAEGINVFSKTFSVIFSEMYSLWQFKFRDLREFTRNVSVLTCTENLSGSNLSYHIESPESVFFWDP
jgi:hypothetical protein